MEKERQTGNRSGSTMKVVGVGLIVLYNVTIVALLLHMQLKLIAHDTKYEELNTRLLLCERRQVDEKFSQITQPFDSKQVEEGMMNLISGNSEQMVAESREKREVLSNKVDLSSVLRGRDGRDGAPGIQGPPGPQGPSGKDGKDGKDSVNMEFVKEIVNTTVNKMVSTEIAKVRLQAREIPTVSGAMYVRWGRTECPAKSDLIYKGRAGGQHYQQTGGSSNYICMPEDPEYFGVATSGVTTLIYGAEYELYNGIIKTISGLAHNAPCTVCQASGRATQYVFPAKLKCPDNSWTKEYSGFLMTEAPGHAGRTEYVCVDQEAEGLPGMILNDNGALFYFVGVLCSGSANEGRFGHCPPYKQTTPITCTVCSK